ncbi:DNA-methyltransferase [Roseibium sp.]|uniref:DNA-methyltransferase n=1 Tax=Roseibium sp. TaxID=1936156 RepID=UPI003B51646A
MKASETFAGGLIRLYEGDARDIAPGLPKTHKLACTDPAYKLTSGGAAKPSGKHKVMQGGWMSDYDNSGTLMISDITWPEIMEVTTTALADDADVYVFANDKNQFAAQVAAREAGLKFHNLLAWNKVNATANRWYMKNLEFVLYLYQGLARKIANCGDKQLIGFPHKDETDHPTEKPVPLIERYIRNSARAGEAVIDPFLGSGTAAIACLRIGNPFTGIEIDPKHFDTACRRVEREIAHPQSDLEAFLEKQGDLAC